MTCGKLKLDIGCGRRTHKGFIGIDVMPYVDGTGKQLVDIVRDIAKHGLPFCDDSAMEILAADVLDHISPSDIVFFMNECWRVLAPDGVLHGTVGKAGTAKHYKDPTHHSYFIVDTFNYFTGVGDAMPDRPAYPRYADYGIMPWIEVEIDEEDDIISFKLIPRKE